MRFSYGCWILGLITLLLASLSCGVSLARLPSHAKVIFAVSIINGDNLKFRIIIIALVLAF